MLVRKAKSPPPPSFKQAITGEKKAPDAIKQLVLLTKQNKFLRDQLESAQKEIQYLTESRNKYKFKYKNLKKMRNRQDNRNWERPRNNEASVNKRRELSGKIYRQRTVEFLRHQPRFIDRNSFLSPSNPEFRQIPYYKPNKFENDNAYGINSNIKQDFLDKINAGIESILDMLALNLKNSERSTEFSLFMQKMTAIQNNIAQQVGQLRQYLGQLEEQKRVESSVVRESRRNERFKSYSSQENNNEQKLMASGNSPPEKDRLQCQEDDRKRKVQEKMSKSKSHGSLNDPKRMKSIHGNNRKYDKDRDKEESEGESTKSKWEMLQEIGKKLQNWKFTNIEDSGLGESGH